VIAPFRRPDTGILALICLALSALACPCPAQEPEQPSRADAERVARLERTVTETESLLQQGNVVAACEACRRAAADADLESTDPDWLAATGDAVWRLGLCAFDAGEFRIAHDAFAAALRHRASTLQEDDLELLKARGNLAVIKHRLGDSRGALDLQEAVLATLSRTRPVDDPVLLDTQSNIAMTRLALGDAERAKELLEQALAVHSALKPEDHPDLVALRHNLSLALESLGDLRGSLALQEKVCEVSSRTLPPEDPRLLTAYSSLASLRKKLGNVEGARALEEWILEVMERTLPPTDLDLQGARLNLAHSKRLMGDVDGAGEIEEDVLRILTESLPDSHPDVQAARGNLAITRKAQGDLRGALDLEQKILDADEARLPDDDLDVQGARLNLAATLHQLGRLEDALALQERAHASLSRTVSEDHPTRLAAAANLAITRRETGNPEGARLLQERVLEVSVDLHGSDHDAVQTARINLAATLYELGELDRALDLTRRAYRTLSSTSPQDHLLVLDAQSSLAAALQASGDPHAALVLQERVLVTLTDSLEKGAPRLQQERVNLAATKHRLGDSWGALDLVDQAIAGYAAVLPQDAEPVLRAIVMRGSILLELGEIEKARDAYRSALAIGAESLASSRPVLTQARSGLGIALSALGDPQAADALFEEVLRFYEARLPTSHPEVQRARSNLANSKAAVGDLDETRRLRELVYEASAAAATSDDDRDLQFARLNLARSARVAGDREQAIALVGEAVRGALFGLCARPYALTDAPIAVARSRAPLDEALSWIDDPARRSSEHGATMARLTAMTLELVNAARSAEARAATLTRAASSDSRLVHLRQELAKATARLRVAIDLAIGSTTVEGQSNDRAQAVHEAALAKAAAEHAVLEEIPAELRAFPSLDALRAALRAGETAITFVCYTSRRAASPGTRNMLGAFILSRTEDPTWHRLSELDPLLERIEALREAARRTGTAANAARNADIGDRPNGRSEATLSVERALLDLGTSLFTPCIESLPAETRTLVLSLPDELQLIPTEELLLADGRRLGDAYTVYVAQSLAPTTSPPTSDSANTGLLAVGAVDFDSDPSSGASAGDPSESVPELAQGAPVDRRFTPLESTALETKRVVSLFASAFPGRRGALLHGAEASEQEFFQRATQKSFLHLATHGYFAPESAWNATDARDTTLARFGIGRGDRIARLSPFSLTGIALAGANLPNDELGRRRGILTAQEIAGLDLSACHLATLSACDTSLGVRRGGTGLASLRQAFHVAGARFVLATLWEVGDSEAERLMADFYRLMWEGGDDPMTALNAAKRLARERGAPFRDWAGWVLTGR
jgi:CHAT domain-containing protein/tetratricopeptide (TPR) repeat protein